MPRSRENAKHIREALVRQATPQKSCPIVEISTTAFAAAGVERRVEDRQRASRPPSLTAATSVAAKVIASRTNQPISAE